MRLLDAELQPISLRGAVDSAVLAALVCASSAMFGLLGGHGAGFAVALFPAVFLGCLMARAGISIVRSPLAALVLTPALVTLVTVSVHVADTALRQLG